MPTTLLSFNPAARALYYGEEALDGLRALGEVRLHEQDQALAGDALIAAASGCQVIVSDRQTPGHAELFAASPELAVFLRCAMDIRNVDVAAASAAGVLVTRASAGFGTSVAEWVLGVMIDLGRGISRSVLAYRDGEQPPVRMGRELRGSHLGIIGYGHIGMGLITPPVGAVLFVGAAIAKLPIEQVTKALLPFFGAMLFVLAMVTYVPAVSLWLPRMFGL